MTHAAHDTDGSDDTPVDADELRMHLDGALEFLCDVPGAPVPKTHAAKSSFATKPVRPHEASLFGDGRSILVVEILGLLSTLSKSGLLWVTTARERFLIQLEAGRIVYAQSDRPPPGWRLGEILLTRGVIDAHDLAEAIASARERSEPLGAWLLAANQVATQDLHNALRDQVQHIFNRMFAATDSTYQFEEGKQLNRSEDVRLNVIQVLLESARIQDERLELPFPIGTPRSEEPIASET